MLSFELTKDTPYLALSGELWSVFYEYFNRNWSCYKGFLLYKDRIFIYGIFIVKSRRSWDSRILMIEILILGIKNGIFILRRPAGVLFTMIRDSTWTPRGRLNKKDGLTRYGDSHVKDKTS